MFAISSWFVAASFLSIAGRVNGHTVSRVREEFHTEITSVQY
jgi:hypothetical protein